jgi:hypothetical protein
VLSPQFFHLLLGPVFQSLGLGRQTKGQAPLQLCPQLLFVFLQLVLELAPRSGQPRLALLLRPLLLLRVLLLNPRTQLLLLGLVQLLQLLALFLSLFIQLGPVLV